MPQEIQNNIVIDTTPEVQHTGTHRYTGGSKFVIADETDATKTVVFNLSGLTTGTETEFTVPESDSAIVTLTATQTLENKTVLDSTFKIADNTTPTKIAQFQCSGLSVGTSTFTLPDGGGTLQVVDPATFTVSVTDDVSITGGDDIELAATAGDIFLTAGATIALDSVSNITLDASAGSISLTATEDISIDGVGAGDDILLNAPFTSSRILINGGLQLARGTTAVSASTSYQNILGITSNAAQRTITLEADMNKDGRIIAITDEAGTAGSTNSIIITPESGTIDGAASDTINSNYGRRIYYGDGTNWHSLVSTIRAGQVYLINSNSRAGTTAGWADFEAQADNLGYLATLPTAQTASTLIVPITGLKKGWILTGFYLVGQIESAGNAVTLDADFRYHVAVAADPSDTSLGTITQISVTADTAVTSANSTKTFVSPYTILGTESFYVKLTGTTTTADCDIIMLSVAAIVTET